MLSYKKGGCVFCNKPVPISETTTNIAYTFANRHPKYGLVNYRLCPKHAKEAVMSYIVEKKGDIFNGESNEFGHCI